MCVYLFFINLNCHDIYVCIDSMCPWRIYLLYVLVRLLNRGRCAPCHSQRSERGQGSSFCAFEDDRRHSMQATFSRLSIHIDTLSVVSHFYNTYIVVLTFKLLEEVVKFDVMLKVATLQFS